MKFNKHLSPEVEELLTTQYKIYKGNRYDKERSEGLARVGEVI